MTHQEYVDLSRMYSMIFFVCFICLKHVVNSFTHELDLCVPIRGYAVAECESRYRLAHNWHAVNVHDYGPF